MATPMMPTRGRLGSAHTMATLGRLGWDIEQVVWSAGLLSTPGLSGVKYLRSHRRRRKEGTYYP